MDPSRIVSQEDAERQAEAFLDKAEIEAAANLIAERLAGSEPAVVEAAVGDALTDEELAEFEEEWNAGARFSGTIARWSPEVRRLIAALRASRAEVDWLRGYIKANPMRACYEEAEAERDALQVEVERLRGENADAIARGAELARAFNAAGRAEMSGPSLPDTAGGVGASPGAGRPPKHVWTCGLKFGDPTCECEAFSRS